MGSKGVECVIVQLWMEPTLCPTGGNGTPDIICGLIQLLLEDKQYSNREDCPHFGTSLYYRVLC
jgi:hypothetical protein